MILGTLPAQELNGSDPVLHFTRPVDGWVQLNDTYHTFSIVKSGADCPGPGHLLVELKIGNETIRKRNLIGYNNNWNINITSTPCIDNGTDTAQLNITFDNATLNGISNRLKDANSSSISVRFIYETYSSGDVSSPTAFIHIKDTSPNDKHQGNNSCGEMSDSATSEESDNSSDNTEGGNTPFYTQAGSTDEVINAGKNTGLFPVVSSSLQLHVVVKFYEFLFSLLILCHIM